MVWIAKYLVNGKGIMIVVSRRWHWLRLGVETCHGLKKPTLVGEGM